MLSRNHVQGTLGIYCPIRFFQSAKPPLVSDLDAKTCPVCAAWDLAEEISGKTISLPSLNKENLKCSSMHAIDFILGGKTILAVEDNPVSMKVLSKTLEPFSRQFMTATNGAEGMKIVEESGNVGLVLLDMDMPIMNGSEFIYQVFKKFGCLPFVVILVSELHDWEEAKKLIEKGVLSSIKKPFTKEDFYNTVLESLLIFGKGLPLTG